MPSFRTFASLRATQRRLQKPPHHNMPPCQERRVKRVMHRYPTMTRTCPQMMLTTTSTPDRQGACHRHRRMACCHRNPIFCVMTRTERIAKGWWAQGAL
jgi:hypothetical protein